MWLIESTLHSPGTHDAPNFHILHVVSLLRDSPFRWLPHRRRNNIDRLPMLFSCPSIYVLSSCKFNRAHTHQHTSTRGLMWQCKSQIWAKMQLKVPPHTHSVGPARQIRMRMQMWHQGQHQLKPTQDANRDRPRVRCNCNCHWYTGLKSRSVFQGHLMAKQFGFYVPVTRLFYHWNHTYANN